MILGVAVKHGDMVIGLPKPNRHHHVIWYIVGNLGIEGPTGHQGQGFYDNKGKYYNREDAREYVIKTGQCTITDHPTELFSEDLW
jgi:hypothetical protein